MSKFTRAPVLGLVLGTVVGGVVASQPVLAQQAYTTRIEPRPVYGATVTIEEGVRVFRPLPPERHVIINPGSATPLNLGFNETRVYEQRSSVSKNTHVHRYPYAYGYRRCHPAVGDSC